MESGKKWRRRHAKNHKKAKGAEPFNFADCPICERIPRSQYAELEEGERLPDEVEKLVPLGGTSGLAGNILDTIKKCPLCGTLYEYHYSHEAAVLGNGCTDESILRITPIMAMDKVGKLYKRFPKRGAELKEELDAFAKGYTKMIEKMREYLGRGSCELKKYAAEALFDHYKENPKEISKLLDIEDWCIRQGLIERIMSNMWGMHCQSFQVHFSVLEPKILSVLENSDESTKVIAMHVLCYSKNKKILASAVPLAMSLLSNENEEVQEACIRILTVAAKKLDIQIINERIKELFFGAKKISANIYLLVDSYIKNRKRAKVISDWITNDRRFNGVGQWTKNLKEKCKKYL